MEQEKDQRLWNAAKKRVQFKRHLYTYLVVNLFLWCLWAMGPTHSANRLPWPAWCTLGWGIGLLFNYVSVYHANDESAIQKEYDKLKNKD